MSIEPIAAFGWLCPEAKQNVGHFLHCEFWATVNIVNTPTKAWKQTPRIGRRTFRTEQLRTSVKVARSWSGGRSCCNWLRVVSQAVLQMKNGRFIGLAGLWTPRRSTRPTNPSAIPWMKSLTSSLVKGWPSNSSTSRICVWCWRSVSRKRCNACSITKVESADREGNARERSRTWSFTCTARSCICTARSFGAVVMSF